MNSKLSAGTAQIIEMMLEKRPSDRYGTASDLIEDILGDKGSESAVHAFKRSISRSLSRGSIMGSGAKRTRRGSR